MTKKVQQSCSQQSLTIAPGFDVKSSALLFAQAQKMGLEPCWETDYGLFSVRLNPKSNKREYFFQLNLNLNGSRARILTKNKHFARLVLEQAGLPNIPFLLPGSREQLLEFFKQFSPLICKPLLGDRSREIQLITTRQELADCKLHRRFFEKYIKGTEYRCLVLKNKVIAQQKKELRPTLTQPWKLFYIGLAQSEWQRELTEMALEIAQLFKLQLAGVDFIKDEQGKVWVLEVNSAPGITKIHQPDAGISINAAKLIWQAILKTGR